ncbi:MAG TPA: MaoC/PaaZ C-terminal domain-containing protein [Pseudomonadales bacterium]|nr:MaoC/PaaZ C-terminal domain-containing protein [Pseudomonadales bacterium]
MTPKNLSASEINIGDKLPALQVKMTAQKIISAAAATRDWQPIHHDHAIAIKSGLRGIILNTPSQAGWISKYITDWAGPQAQIKRLAFKMKDSICPDDEMTISGEVTGKQDTTITVKITLTAGDILKTSAEVLFTAPA